MTGMLIAVMLMAAPAQDEIPAPVQRYLARCEENRRGLVARTEEAIQTQEAVGKQTPDAARRLEANRELLAQLKSKPAPLMTLPIPPEKDDLGAFPPKKVDGHWGRFVDVLEVIDKNSAVIRVWYTPGIAPDKKDADRQIAGKQAVSKLVAAAKDPVPLDFWAQGIDTTGMTDHSQAELSQVFQAVGNKGLPTDCGTRNLMVLAPIDVERFRGGAK